MKIPKIPSTLVLAAIALAIFTVPAHSQVFDGSGSNSAGVYDYSDGADWTGGTIPNLNNTTNTATISDGLNVGYYSGEHGDLIISGGATLEIKSGSWTQEDGGSWLQLGANGGGNGNILIDGGTFNQGTVGSNPFNLTNGGNTFTISSGAANFNKSVNLNTGLTWLQSGGTVTISAGELDDNSTTASMTGGTLTAILLTSQNSGDTGTFNFSGGIINLTGNTGIYGGNTKQLNFTTTSTGVLNFTDTTDISTSTVQAMVNSGVISYNGTTDASAFTVSGDPGSVSVFLTIPEPSTYALFGLGSLGMLFVLRRKRAGLVS